MARPETRCPLGQINRFALVFPVFIAKPPNIGSPRFRSFSATASQCPDQMPAMHQIIASRYNLRPRTVSNFIVTKYDVSLPPAKEISCCPKRRIDFQLKIQGVAESIFPTAAPPSSASRSYEPTICSSTAAQRSPAIFQSPVLSNAGACTS